jgi:hypothetical protein
MHKHGKTCCRTTFHILKQLDLLTLRGKRKDIIHKHGKTCCRTTSHIYSNNSTYWHCEAQREDIIHKHGKTCCRTTSHILNWTTRLIDTARQTWRYHTQTRQNMLPNNISYTQTNSTYWRLRGKRKDIIHKYGKTCCRTTSHILKQLDLLTLRGKTWRYRTQTRQNMLPNNSSYTQTTRLIDTARQNVKISCTNTAKHAAEQHIIYSNNSTYWHCELTIVMLCCMDCPAIWLSVYNMCLMRLPG